jgi:UDP-galactopyranose mutase
MLEIESDLSLQILNADLVIVGAGLFGLTIAERAANLMGKKVVIIEKREHLGGNAYSYFDEETKIEIHKYGTHLFHTSNQRVWDYVNEFTGFNEYQHHVLTIHKNRVYTMPINLGTITQFFERVLTPLEARELINSLILEEGIDAPSNFEEKALSLLGRPMYEAFIKNYTHKQWDLDPTKLPSEIISRLPIRYNYNSRYFSDTHEGLPLEGYSAWFNKMVDNQNIRVALGIDFFKVRHLLRKNTPIVYTGPIDRYFDYAAGHLGWRTLDFTLEKLPIADFQGTSVMNYADLEFPFTRIHEFKHLHPERRYGEESTIIMREYSRVSGISDEPFYPINSENDRTKLLEYRKLMKNEHDTIFGGRLGTYQYLDMHMAIASALQTFEKEVMVKLAKRNAGSP